MAEADSEVTEAAATESTPEVGDFDFGADLEGARVEAEGDPGTPIGVATSQDNGTSKFDADNVDWLRVDPETLPSEYRPLSSVARNMQAGVTKVVEGLQEQQRQSADREQQYLRLLTAQNEEDSKVDPFAGANEAERGAIDAIREVVRDEHGDTARVQEDKIGTLTQSVGHLVGQNRQQQVGQLNAEAVSLRSTYGADIDRYADLIKADLQLMNPATQKPYTMTESYEMRSGKIVDRTIKARQGDRQAREGAAQDTFVDGAVEDAQGAQPLNERDLLSAVGKLRGFHSSR